jgi:radical SAM superfamily enzyme YgiQ (UPF0313 family)
MNILLVYPEYPDTFWGFKNALKFVGKKAAFPPLGLLTVAAMLPKDWNLKLVDMNVENLDQKDILWADLVFISAMVVQRDSAKKVIEMVRKIGKETVAGGPLFTTEPEQFSLANYLVLGEAELNLQSFIKDFLSGQAKNVYPAGENIQADIIKTPLPLWRLIEPKYYASMSIQYSRGCPFDCEFCDIVFLDGHIPRTKNKEQVAKELDAIYAMGWRGSLFIVDDNFIGNKKKLKEEILPAIIAWQKKKKFPFSFFTEASINLADDQELMDKMAQAGFNRVFIGIETPNAESLNECGKKQNMGRDLLDSVRVIQNKGLEVMGGFIIGFDNDPTSIFNTQTDFIQRSGIVTAMVGLLNAPRGSSLYNRLAKEKRLLGDNFTGNNMDFSMNFIPKMNQKILLKGYKEVLRKIYSPKRYYERLGTFLREYHPKTKTQFNWYQIRGLLNCIRIIGFGGSGKSYFWKLFFWILFGKPRSFSIFIALCVYGYHFRRIIQSKS